MSEFNSFVSSGLLIGNKYLDIIKSVSNLSRDFLTLESNDMLEKARKSFVRIGISYNSLSYTISTESPKFDVVSLLANVGGNLGLFLGVSVFSVCELLEALIGILRIYKQTRRQT